MNEHIKKLIELGAIIGGRKKEVDGFTIFERLPIEELEKVPQDDLAFATMAMGRAVFTINEDGTITNYKGVDSHLSNEESASKSLVKADAAYSSKNGEGYEQSNFPINLVVFPGSKPDVRIRGLSHFVNLEYEAYTNFRMQNKGIKLPKIESVKEFSQEFLKHFGLPMKVEGSFPEVTPDYQEENDRIKQILKTVYSDSYKDEEIAGKRAETLGEYFRRINIQNDPNIINFLDEKGIPFEAFISYVDHIYTSGQRYGQAIRQIESPFRIADIEYYTKQGNIDVLENIASFTESIYPDRVPFENYFATQMGTNLANMMNNGWSCENFSHRQDYSLAGEMCDDSYIFVPEKLKHAERLIDKDLGRMQVKKSDIRLKFFLQTYLLSSNIKVLQDSMLLRGKSREEIDSVLDNFIDAFTQNLDLEKTSLNISGNPNTAKEAFEILARTPKNVQKLLAFAPAEPGKPQYSEEVLQSHEGYNAFYDNISSKIAERLGFRRTFINQTEQDKKGVQPYNFLEDR